MHTIDVSRRIFNRGAPLLSQWLFSFAFPRWAYAEYRNFRRELKLGLRAHEGARYTRRLLFFNKYSLNCLNCWLAKEQCSQRLINLKSLCTSNFTDARALTLYTHRRTLTQYTQVYTRLKCMVTSLKQSHLLNALSLFTLLILEMEMRALTLDLPPFPHPDIHANTCAPVLRKLDFRSRSPVLWLKFRFQSV